MNIYGDPHCLYFSNLTAIITEFDAAFSLLENFRPAHIFDIGANIGLFTLACARRFSGVQLHAYEAHPNAFEALRANVGGIAEVHRLAVGQEPGKLGFRPGGPIIRQRSSGSHMIDWSDFDPSFDIAVDVTTLSAEFSRLGPQGRVLGKIDVEGFELEVLRATPLRPDTAYLVEFNSWCLIGMRRQIPQALLDYLRDRFTYIYRVRNGLPNFRIVTDDDAQHFLHSNLTQHGCIDDLVLSNVDLNE